MKNRFDIKEFRLLIHLDPRVLTVLAVTLDGTRAENFDYLDYQVNYNGVYGDLRITSRAGYAEPIPVGDGPICRVTVQVSSDLNYVGNEISLRFVNHVVADNVLIMSLGQTVTSGMINFFNGYILIGQSGSRILGDINLNGVGFEIADAVYFTNFFISPGLYPIDGQRLVNSDINQDGFAPSIADLVLLIKIIVGEAPRPSGKPDGFRPASFGRPRPYPGRRRFISGHRCAGERGRSLRRIGRVRCRPDRIDQPDRRWKCFRRVRMVAGAG